MRMLDTQMSPLGLFWGLLLHAALHRGIRLGFPSCTGDGLPRDRIHAEMDQFAESDALCKTVLHPVKLLRTPRSQKLDTCPVATLARSHEWGQMLVVLLFRIGTHLKQLSDNVGMSVAAAQFRAVSL